VYAEDLLEVLSTYFKPNRGAKEGYYKLDPNNGIDYFLKETTCHAVIMEPEFIQNLDLINSSRVLCCKMIAKKLEEMFA
jgi:hypothetical protein